MILGCSRRPICFSSERFWICEILRKFASVYDFNDGDSTLCGSININSGTNAVSFETSSDYRLKEYVVPLTGALARLKTLKPKRFNFISDETNTLRDGFLAHEAQSVVDESVSGTKDQKVIFGALEPEKGWKGLKLKFLEDLVLVDIKGEDPEMELPFDEPNAQLLVENSNEFDNWLNEVVFDLENFRSSEQKENKEAVKAVPGPQ